MAKREPEKAPKVTNLPLPASDTPLVIDLPDGQKIVVGKLPTGSVIEIATWRGTGRPDSRTNRLMMGMNTKEAVNEAAQSAPKPEVAKNASSKKIENLKSLIFSFFEILKRSLNLLIEKSKKNLIKNSETKPAESKVTFVEPTRPSTSPDVDEWLAKIIEKSEKRREREEQGKSTTKRPASKAAQSKSKKSR